MGNLFTRLKDKLSRDYGGRYIGVLLEQVIADAPKTATVLFPGLDPGIIKKLNDGTAQVVTEWRFPGRGQNNRRADLAIVDGETPLALCEIKYEDHLSAGNPAQARDYLTQCRANGAAFVYLTQHTPSEDTLALITAARGEGLKAHHLFYRDLYRKLQKVGNHTARLFCEFLEEQHVIYKDGFDDDALNALRYLMVRGLYVKHAHGFGTLKSEANVRYAPEVLSGLIGNVMALAEWFRGELHGHFNQRFRPSFAFDPMFKTSARPIDGQDWDYIRREDRTGGYFWVFGDGSVSSGKDEYATFDIGYKFELDLSAETREKKIKAYIAAETYYKGQENKDYYAWKQFTLRSNLALPEARARKLIVAAAAEVLGKVLSDSPPPPVPKRLAPLLADIIRLEKRMSD